MTVHGSRNIREKVGILGGSFNPIHNGHLLAAQAFVEKLDLDRLFLVPSARPPHKEAGMLASPKHRYIMTRMAVCSQPRLEVSGMELERPGLSYTVDTIAHFCGLYPTAELHFMMGWDAFQLIETWKDPERLAAMCSSIVVVNRPGSDAAAVDKIISSLDGALAARLIFMEIPGIEISSTEIRRRVRAGFSIACMVPAPVEQFIINNNLYKDICNEGNRRH